MRVLGYATSIIATVSAIVLTVLLYIPIWSAYTAHASLDFSRVTALNGNYQPNYTSSTYQLRHVVVVFSWVSAIFFVVAELLTDYGPFRKQRKPVLDDIENSYIRKANQFWTGVALVVLLEGFIVSVFCGVNTLVVNALTALSLSLTCVLVGPIHNHLNKDRGLVRREWIGYTVGVLVFVVYSFLTLMYLIQAAIWGPGVLNWSVWALVFGSWVCKAVIVIAQAFFWSRLSKKLFIYIFYIAELFAVLWVGWMFFARTVVFTP